MTREKFNQKYTDIIKDISKLDDKNFNIFKVLRLTDYEIRHSNFLAWLLNNPIFFKEFINVYNNAAKDAKRDENINSNVEIKEIEREESFDETNEDGQFIYIARKNNNIYYKVGPNTIYTLIKTPDGKVKKIIEDKTFAGENLSWKKIGRYIDLNIIGDDFTISIENKIDTGEHDFQCIAYRNYIEKAYKGKKTLLCFLRKGNTRRF